MGALIRFPLPPRPGHPMHIDAEEADDLRGAAPEAAAAHWRERSHCLDCGDRIERDVFPHGYIEGMDEDGARPRWWACWQKAPEPQGFELARALWYRADELGGSFSDTLKEFSERVEWLNPALADSLGRVLNVSGIENDRDMATTVAVIHMVLEDGQFA